MIPITRVTVCGLVVFACITITFGTISLTSPGPPVNNSISVEIVETAPTDLDDPDIPNVYDVWIGLFENAENTIDIEAPYISHYTYSGEQYDTYNGLFDKLQAAAGRGVQIRIMTNTWPSGLEYLANNENIQMLNPTNEVLDIHAKYIVVDGKKAFVGSQNWSTGGVLNNREMGVLIENKQLAGAYTYIFETGWVAAGGEARGDKFGEAEWIYPVASGPEMPVEARNTKTALENLINSANQSIKVYLYVFSTGSATNSLASALTDAAGRGVEVQLMLDARYYKKIWSEPIPGNYQDFSDRLDGLKDVEGIWMKIIYPEEWIFCHPKIVIVDGERAYVGSANWTSSSLLNRREVGVIFRDQTLASTLEGIFRTDWESEYTKWVKEPENPLLIYVGVIIAGLAIAVAIILVRRRSKAKRKKRKWIAELWASSRHEI